MSDDEPDWAAYVRNLRETLNLSQKDLGEKCGLSVFAIRRIEQGDKPKVFEATKIREYVESLPIVEERLPLPRHGFDETSLVLMSRVIKHQKERDRLEGLAKNVISRLSDDKPELVETLATNLLKQYIASITDA